MKQIIFSLFLLISPYFAFAQNEEWKAYLSYIQSSKSVTVGDMVFSIGNGSLFSYDTSDSEVRIYDKPSGLSDCNIKNIAYCKNIKALVLLYANKNIDILTLNNEVYNLPQFKNSSQSDNTINELNIADNYAFISTNTGIVVVNLQKKEFTSTYNIGVSVVSTTKLGDYIYAATKEGLYRGKMSDNLIDKNQWTKVSTDIYDGLCIFDGKVVGKALPSGVYTLTKEGTKETMICPYNYTCFYADEQGRLIISSYNQINVVYPGSLKPTTSTQSTPLQWISFTSNSDAWISCGNEGLQPWKLVDNKYEQNGNAIQLNSPIRNLFSQMSLTEDNRLIVAGGSFNYSNITYDATIMRMDEGKWTNYDLSDVKDVTGFTMVNVNNVAQDPLDKTHLYATAIGTGLYEFKDDKIVQNYNLDNSPLYSVLPTSTYKRLYVRMSSLNFDKQGNLWMANNQVDTIVVIKMKDGTWEKIYVPEISGYPTFDKTIFDQRGWAWLNSRRATGISKAGAVCINYNGTISDKSDDQYKFIGTFVNQDNTSYSISKVNDIAEDLDGNMWIGTDIGPFVIEDVNNIFNVETPITSQIKIPRNDGTNYADYLLSGTAITAIAIDGANRKWFGTSGNGLYLISADGQETIHHFTIDNSALLSNTINCLAINGETGEIMIGTDAGLCSYQSNATNPAETLEKDNVKVYPNPVRPDYYGDIQITGLTYGAEVKISSVGGQLITKGTSEGGSFTWNGRDKNGKHVGTGVYYILATTEDGNNGIVGKIIVVK